MAPEAADRLQALALARRRGAWRKIESAPIWLHRSRPPLPFEFEDSRSEGRSPEIKGMAAGLDTKLNRFPIQRVGGVHGTCLESRARPWQHHRATKIHRQPGRDDATMA